MSDPKVAVWLVLSEEGAILVARRKPEARPFAGNWGLPGDVMDEEESADETMARVGLTHLDVRVTSVEFMDTLYLKDRGDEYAINVFEVQYGGRARYRESGPYDEVRWETPEGLASLVGFPAELATKLAERVDNG